MRMKHYRVTTTEFRRQFHKADESPEGAPIGSPDKAPSDHHVSMDSVGYSFPLTPQTASSGLPDLPHSGIRPPFSAMHPFYEKNFLNVFGRPPPRPVGNLVKPHPKSVLREMLMNTSIYAKNVFININRNIPPASPGMLFRPNTFGLPMPYPPISQAAIFTTPQSFVDPIFKLITSPVLQMLYLLMKDLRKPDSGKIDHPPTASGGSTVELKTPPEPQLLQSANETSKSDNEEMIQFGQMNTGVSQNQQQQVHEELSPLLQIDEYFLSHENRTGTAQNTPIKIEIGKEISNNTLDEIDTGLDKANTTFFNNSLADHLRQPLSNLALPDKMTTENVTETPNTPIPTYVRTTQNPIVIKPTHGKFQ